VDGEQVLGPGEAWVLSDNPADGVADSRRFGPVPIQSLQPAVTRLDETTFAEAVELLSHEEEVFAAAVGAHGAPPFWTRPAGFPTLAWLILEQQVSLESGAEMYRRLHGLVGEITPEAVVASGEAALRGIGPWTADAYLLSALRFPDVFPLGDRALQVGTGEVLGLAAVPDPSELELLSAPWRPLRAVAARIIWHSYLANRGRVEPPDPTAEHASRRGA
jgi:DNA-3-methyladenine glycosylase II